jgi:hypothetical protein
MRVQAEDDLIRRYLLGDLPESAMNSLEGKYFADGEVFEQVWAVENDLVDDYVAGRLIPTDRGLFERHYLASPRHQERVATARALRAAGLAAAAPAAKLSARRPVAIPVLGWSLAAAVLLAVVAGSLWRSWSEDARRTVKGSRVAPTSLPESSPEAAPPTLRPTASILFALAPTLVRGATSPPELRIPSGTDEIQLLLGADGAEEPPGERGTQLTVTVRTVEGKSVWKGQATATDTPNPRPLATVRLPAARLPSGDYILTLSAIEPSQPEAELHKYYLRVAR